MERDDERAARDEERLRLKNILTKKRDSWEAEHKLDEVVDVNDIAGVFTWWTGIPASQMMETWKPNAC